MVSERAKCFDLTLDESIRRARILSREVSQSDRLSPWPAASRSCRMDVESAPFLCNLHVPQLAERLDRAFSCLRVDRSQANDRS